MTALLPAGSHETVRFAPPRSGAAGTVLLIEDDAPLARSLIRVMNAEGYQVVHVGSGAAAVEKVMSRSFDAVISDLNLPGASGVDVLNVVRAYDPDVPLVLMTGCPTVDTAIEAVSLGVLEYLVKPTPREHLVRVLGRCSKVRRSAIHRREASDSAIVAAATAETVRPPSSAPSSDPLSVVNVNANRMSNASAETAPSMEAVVPDSHSSSNGTFACPSIRATFERALSTLSVELEPIADAKTKKLLGYGARMSSEEETLSTETALVVCAERLGRLEELRRRVRDLAVKTFVDAPPDALLFIDVHPSDLLDGDLYSPEPPLARIAERVVLQVRARGLSVEDICARASVLRFVGFRLAIADLDAGQACLSQIADLSPEFVKIDTRLVKNVNGSANRKRLVTALVSMCKSLDAVAIAEGVSTAEESEALSEAGCTLVQGSIVRRHSPLSLRQPLSVAAATSSTLRSRER
jgi:EAL domain-containing protein (putative c-di-GMP-specific phosphodiesterase class I)/ActR/RegA family two-component response regulator